jgi:hypothetical protein
MSEYFVIDCTGCTSINTDGESEAFGTLKEARLRARELAVSEPEYTIVIAQSVAYMTCDQPRTKTVRERRLRV